ncbi:MAG: YfhO family protein [Oscillospiraceae bacterium]|nr:YfhO family protein [Oscillospiraceae bacterium]
MNNQKQKERLIWAALLSLAVACAYCILLKFSNIYPFGTDTFLRVDMGMQYADFLSFVRNSSLTEKIYSFSKSFGGQTWALMAYYGFSPFNLILYLFPAQKTELAIFVMVGAKFVFMALAAYIYFCNHYENNMANRGFAFAYALYPYFVRYYFNTLWFDVFALLPLLVLATEKVINSEKRAKGLFIFLYLWALVSNYYVSYMASVFILLYFVFYCFGVQGVSVKTAVKKALEMAYSVAVSLMLAAPVLIPAFIQLVNGKFNDLPGFDRSFSDGIYNILMSVVSCFDGTYMIDNIPQFAFSSLAVILMIALIVNSTVSLKYRISSLMFMAFMGAGLYLGGLYYMWHGFSWPEGFPFRNTFVYAFLLVLLCRHSFEKLDFRTAVKTIVIGGGFYFACFVYYIKFNYLQWSAWSSELTLVAVAAAFALMALTFRWERQAKNMMCILLAALSLINGCRHIRGEKLLNDAVNPTKAGGEYEYNYTAVSDALDYADDDSFYRVEDLSARIYNQPMGLGYYGVNHFSSTYDKQSQEIAAHYGYGTSMYTTLYRLNRLLPDSFMGMKYFLCEDIWNISDKCDFIYDGERNLYYNPYHIPVVFTGVTNSIKSNADGDRHINNMFATLTGIPVLDDSCQVNYENLAAASEILRNNAAEIITEKGAVIKLTATGKYLLTTIMYEDGWNIWVNGEKVQPEPFMDHFLSAPLTEGECNVTMVYIPQGFVPGVCLMVCGVAVMAAMLIIKKKNTKGE